MTAYNLLKTLSSRETEVEIYCAIDGNQLWHGNAHEFFDVKFDKSLLNAKVHYWDYAIPTSYRVMIVIYV